MAKSKKPLVFISVNKQIIARNSRTGSEDPPISLRYSKSGKATQCDGIIVDGPSMLYYNHRRPILKCGARLVMVANAEDTTMVFLQKRKKGKHGDKSAKDNRRSGRSARPDRRA